MTAQTAQETITVSPETVTVVQEETAKTKRKGKGKA